MIELPTSGWRWRRSAGHGRRRRRGLRQRSRCRRGRPRTPPPIAAAGLHTSANGMSIHCPVARRAASHPSNGGLSLVVGLFLAGAWVWVRKTPGPPHPEDKVTSGTNPACGLCCGCGCSGTAGCGAPFPSLEWSAGMLKCLEIESCEALAPLPCPAAWAGLHAVSPTFLKEAAQKCDEPAANCASLWKSVCPWHTKPVECPMNFHVAVMVGGVKEGVAAKRPCPPVPAA